MHGTLLTASSLLSLPPDNSPKFPKCLAIRFVADISLWSAVTDPSICCLDSSVSVEGSTVLARFRIGWGSSLVHSCNFCLSLLDKLLDSFTAFLIKLCTQTGFRSFSSFASSRSSAISTIFSLAIFWASRICWLAHTAVRIDIVLQPSLGHREHWLAPPLLSAASLPHCIHPIFPNC